MITKYIGQAPVVSNLNEILQAFRNEKKAGRPYQFRPINFGGWTGTGKSNLANAFAQQVEDSGFNYTEVTPNAGMRDLYKVFSKLASVDEESGEWSAIPYVVFWDEFHSQKIALDILKALTTKVEERHSITRQGFLFTYDPTCHVHIFASNHSLDKAMQRRCRNFSLTTYTKSEMSKLAELFLSKHGIMLDESGMEALLGRCKPLAGDLEEVISPLVSRAKAEGISKLKGEVVTDVLKKQGFFSLGLRRPDVAVIRQLVKGPQTASVLKFEVQDEKKKDTQERIDYLCAIHLAMPVRGGFALSEKGKEYADNLIKAQQKAKASKASK